MLNAMYKYLFLGIISALLAACSAMSSTALFKPDASPAQKQHDLDQCKIASLRSIPQAFTTMTAGGFYDPGGVDCYPRRDGRMVCTRYGDVFVPPASYTVDQNEGLRWRFVMGCLQKKGYRIINQLRPCRNQEERRRAMAARTVAAFTCDPDGKLDY